MSKRESLPPALWSDFDGTAVKKYAIGHPFNASKYPLPIMPGYVDFLDGFSDGGGIVRGVLTRRGNIRRPATMRSLQKLGLESRLMAFPGNVIHFNSDRGKAAHVLNDADHGTPRSSVSLIEDKPDVVGMEMIDLLKTDEAGWINEAFVTIGAVNTVSQAKRIDNFESQANHVDGVTVNRVDESTLAVTVGSSVVYTTALRPYTFEEGQNFATLVQANADYLAEFQ